MRRTLLPLLLALTACGEGSGDPVRVVAVAPGDPLRVSIAAPSRLEGQVVEDAFGQFYLRCLVDMTATATGGSAGEAALWHSGAVDYYSLATGGLVSGFDLGLQGLIEIWGSRRLEAGRTQLVRLVAYEYLPFLAVFRFRYTTETDSTLRTVTTSTECHLSG